MNRWRKQVDMIFRLGATKEHFETAIRDAYIQGLKAGYDLAERDFYSLDGTDDWVLQRPTLYRVLGGFKRWEKRHGN